MVVSKRTQILGGAGIGFAAVAGAMLFFSGAALTPVSFDCSSCPAGRATVTVTASDPVNRVPPVQHQADVDLPTSSGVYQVELALLAIDYRVDAMVRYPDGRLFSAESQTVTGLGDPLPAPEPTPTGPPAPTPTSEPTPLPTTTPVPPGAPSPNCTVLRVTEASGVHTPAGEALVDPAGRRWTIEWSWVLVNGGYSMPGSGPAMGAKGTALKIVDGVVYSLEPRDGLWYRFVDFNHVVAVGAAEPACGGVPTPTPTVTPTPTPPPTPEPVAQPLVEAKTCAINLAAPRPASVVGTGWKVQYFDGTLALATSSSTVKRAVTIRAGLRDQLRAVWVRAGVTVPQPLAPVTCLAK